jgi:hypothetical protein
VALLLSACVALGQPATAGESKNNLANLDCSLNQWRFVAYGDQSTNDDAGQLVSQILSWHEPDACYPIKLVAHAGDAAYALDAESTARLWWHGTVRPLRSIPLGNLGRNYLLALGNHDQDTSELRQWYVSNVLAPLFNQSDWPVWRCEPGTQPSQCERLIYSYSYHNAHFIVADLDAGGNPQGKRERDTRVGPRAVSWIASDIGRAKRSDSGCKDNDGQPVPCDWIFYLSHPPCFSLEGPIGDAYFGHGDDAGNCSLLEPAFARGVDVVIQGHTHQYYRTFPMLPGDHSNPQPKCGNKCPDENYTSTDLEGAPIYLTVGTGGEGAYPNPDFHWANNHERLNAYAAAFPLAGGQIRDSGLNSNGRAIRRVPVTSGAARVSINGRCLLMEFVGLKGEVYDRFTIDKNGGQCEF